MAMRVYIVAADSAAPLQPSFKEVPGGRLSAAFEVMDWTTFRSMGAPEVGKLWCDLATELKRPDLIPTMPGYDPEGRDEEVAALYADEEGLPEERG